MTELSIRLADENDLPFITRIYNHYVLHSTATFDGEPKTDEDQLRWLNQHGGKHPVLAALWDQHGVGWASLTGYSDRCAYAETVELSVYVDHEWHGRGIGKALMRELISHARVSGIHTILARITADNAVSLHLHASLGFREVGVMKEVGVKFGQRLDVHLLQMMLK